MAFTYAQLYHSQIPMNELLGHDVNQLYVGHASMVIMPTLNSFKKNSFEIACRSVFP